MPQLFGDFIEADSLDGPCVVLTLSMRKLGPKARNAIQKSLVALDFGNSSCTYATLLPHPADTPPEQAAQSIDSNGGLDAQALFLLVEGLDPLHIIATDRPSRDLLGRAYRTEYPLDASARVFGRPSAVFEDLSTLLETDAGKQKAWSLFKALRQG